MRQLSALLLAALGAATASASTPPSSYHYYLYDQVVPLDLDASHVAVLASRPNDQAGIAAAASARGVTADAEPRLLERWWNVRTADGRRSAADVEALVADLSEDASVEFVSPVFLDSRGLPVLMTRELFVRFEPGVDQATAEAMLASYGVEAILEKDFAGMANVYHARSGARDGMLVLDQANALHNLDGVVYAEPNKLYTAIPHLFPNDPSFSLLWGLHNTGQQVQGSFGVNDKDMDGPEAWDLELGDPNIRVAILDSGVQQNHPDLNQITGVNFSGSGPADGSPGGVCDRHGTAVAGTVSATINNGVGIVGICPECKVVSVKIAVESCGPTWTISDSAYASALNWCISNARVTNHSGSGGGAAVISDAYNLSHSLGVVHFTSSGNDGVSGMSFPATLGVVYAVGAANNQGQRASFSNYGDGLDFVAPGQSIYTLDRTGTAGYAAGDYTFVDGTSFSSPYAAGVAGLILSRWPSFKPAAVLQVMTDTCVDISPPGFDEFTGFGMLNARAALSYNPPFPGAFSRVSPMAGAAGVNTSPLLEWALSPNAQTYDVQVDTAPTFDTLNAYTMTGVAGSSLQLAGDPLSPLQTYYWRVIAENDFGTQEIDGGAQTFTTFWDCNGDELDDAAQIAANPELDCNGNGRLDACDITPVYAARSLRLYPFGNGQPTPEYPLPTPYDAAGNVTLEFSAVGDLNTGSEYVDVQLNSTSVGRVFETGALDCAVSTASLVVPASTFNAAKLAGGGQVTIRMIPSAGVNPAPPACTNQVYIQVAASYSGAPTSLDANQNGVPDECDGPAACPGDLNCDGAVNFGDIDAFVLALQGEAAYLAAYPGCRWLNGDTSGDQAVNFSDIDAFVALIGTICP